MAVVQTVLGSIEPNLLGRTLTHEHLSLNCEKFYVEGPEEYKPYFSRVNLVNLGFIRQYPFSSKDNLRFNDEAAHDAVIKDVHLYKKFGGGAIVDNSSHGLAGRDLEFLVEVSQKTGVHVIAGSGHYLHSHQTPEQLNMTVEQMTDLYTKDIVTGVEVDKVGLVKCGVIGEVGSGFPMHNFEKRAVRATGEVQEALGVGVSFHPGPNPEAPFEILRLYLEAGGNANKCVMSHLDRTIFDMEKLFEFAKLGCYMQYDFFGTENSTFQLDPANDLLSDGQRINNIIKLIDEGYLDRITMSHDMHAKHMLTSYGGFGYHHLHMNVLPRFFERGLTVEQVERMTVSNPAEWLEFNI